MSERFAEAPPAPDNPTAVEAHRLKTLEGGSCTPSASNRRTVFGIIKSVLGFRQFLLRGLDKVRGEWNLVTLAWNLKRMLPWSPLNEAGITAFWPGRILMHAQRCATDKRTAGRPPSPENARSALGEPATVA